MIKISLQTKEHAIGYILKAMIDSGSNSKELKNMYYKLNETIDKYLETQNKINNDITFDFMTSLCLKFNFCVDKIKKIGSFLLYAFDIYTVDDASEFYHSFKTILRIKD